MKGTKFKRLSQSMLACDGAPAFLPLPPHLVHHPARGYKEAAGGGFTLPPRALGGKETAQIKQKQGKE